MCRDPLVLGAVAAGPFRMQPFKPENVLVCIRRDEKGEGEEAEGGGGGKEKNQVGLRRS